MPRGKQELQSLGGAPNEVRKRAKVSEISEIVISLLDARNIILDRGSRDTPANHSPSEVLQLYTFRVGCQSVPLCFELAQTAGLSQAE
jgi:hypothetical protein